MTPRIRRGPDIAIGVRYRRRESKSAVWEVYGVLDVKVGPPHVMLFKVSDPTQRKTLSEFTLERSGSYYRLPEDCQIDGRTV